MLTQSQSSPLVKIATAQSIHTKLKQGYKQIRDNKETLQRRQQELQQFLTKVEQEVFWGLWV